jgi:hypothetical protein
MVGALEPDGRFLCRCRRCGVILKFFLVWLKVAVGQPLKKEVQSAVRSFWKGVKNEIWRAIDVTSVLYGFYFYPRELCFCLFEGPINEGRKGDVGQRPSLGSACG